MNKPLTDFNDLENLIGLEEVKKQIDKVISNPDAFSVQTDNDHAWPELIPIPNNLLPVEPFCFSLLPDKLRPWVEDASERMQCPPDFQAVGVMVALSSLIGRKACIQPKRYDSWTVMPNLWGAVVGRPGVMKSPALTEAMRSLSRLASEASEAHRLAMIEHEVNERLISMAAKANEKKAEQAIAKGQHEAAKMLLYEASASDAVTAPQLRRYIVNDASVEALGEILIGNPWGILAYRDELNGLLRSLDREGQEGARAFYLQGYDGNQGYTFDRIGRGKNLHIPAVCIALLGGIQPGKLQAYIRDAISGGAGDDGLLQRFGLLVWPDVEGEWRNVDRRPRKDAQDKAFEIFRQLDNMRPAIHNETGEEIPEVYRFDEDAQVQFDRWRSEIEPEMRSGALHPALESHLSKYRKLVPAIALVIALAEGEQVVSVKSLGKALGWSEYLRSHAERAYGAGTQLDTDAATTLLKKIKAGNLGSAFSARDVYLKGWSLLGTPEAVHAAAKILCDLHHLRRFDTKPPGGGRPSIVYEINPVLVVAR